MDFVDSYEGCMCKTNGCCHFRCPCFTRNVGCTSKCKCPVPVCVNIFGVRVAGESNAEPGVTGTGGTGDISDEAESESESEPKRESQVGQPMCRCVNCKCLDGHCVCFSGNWLCSEDCVCKGCRNTESNEKDVQMLYKVFVKRKSRFYKELPLEAIPKRKMGAGSLANGQLCFCKARGCLKCACSKLKLGCTPYCKCRDCRNPYGAGGTAASNAETGGQGGADGASDIPYAAAHTTAPSRAEPGQDFFLKREPGKVDTSSSIAAGEPAQMEHPAQSADVWGPGPEKRPRLR